MLWCFNDIIAYLFTLKRGRAHNCVNASYLAGPRSFHFPSSSAAAAASLQNFRPVFYGIRNAVLQNLRYRSSFIHYSQVGL